MRLADSKITITLELDSREHYRLASALRNICIFAEKESNSVLLQHDVKEGVKPFLYFLNLSIPTRATASGWPEWTPENDEGMREEAERTMERDPVQEG